MSQNTQDNAETLGKVEGAKHRFYGDTDLSNLNYLEHRDMTRVAKDLNTDIQRVSKVKRLVIRNTSIMAALLKKGGENRKKLTEAIA